MLLKGAVNIIMAQCLAFALFSFAQPQRFVQYQRIGGVSTYLMVVADGDSKPVSLFNG